MIITNYSPEDVNSEAHQKLLSLLPHKTDTAVDAVRKFESFLDNIQFELRWDDEDPIQLKVKDVKDELLKLKPENPDNIKRFEEKHGVTVPASLSEFILKKGLLEIEMGCQCDDDGTVVPGGRIPFLKFYDHNDPILFPNIMDLPHAIANNFSSNFMQTTYSESDVDFFRKNFFVFASFNINDQEYDYLFFTRDGQFGSFNFKDEDYSSNENILNSLLKKTAKFETFDQLISRYISRAMLSFAEELMNY